MPITVTKDSNGKIIKNQVPISTTPPIVNNSVSLGKTDINYSGSINSLKLNNVSVISTGTQLNYVNVTPGTATESKAVILDASSSISNLNSVSCNTSITVNGNIVTGTIAAGSASYLTGISAGTAASGKVAVVDSSNNIAGINEISSNSVTLNNWNLSTSVKQKNYNLKNYTINQISNTNQWNSICRADSINLFVAVASTGTGDRVMTSSNGNTWITRSAAVDNNWTSVCWSQDLGLFVAVASSGTGNRVMTSPNGITWTSQTSASDNNWTSVCWASELTLFIAVASSGSGNRVMTSPDGITWTSRSSTADNNWTSVCWSTSLNLLVAVSSDGTTNNQIMTSTNGSTWTSRTSPVTNSWVSICWGSNAGVFVAVSNTGNNNRSMISTDGINWKAVSTKYNNDWNNIIFSQEMNMFIAIASAGNHNKIAFSKNGKYWNFVTLSNHSGLSCIAWSSSLNIFSILTMQYSSSVNLSTIMSNWNALGSTSTSGSSARSIVWVSELGIYIYTGTNGALLTSTNGVNWTLRSTVSTNTWNSVAYSPSLELLVAVSNSNTTTNSIITSIDGGINWTARTAPYAYNWISVCYSSSLGMFVAVAASSPTTNTIMTSTDGINWSAQTGVSSTWWKIIWVDALNLFVAIGSSSPYLMTSSNGTAWTTRSPSTNTTWKSLDWSPELNLFVAVADSGSTRVMTSTNGTSWTNQTSQVTSQWSSVCWCSNLGIFVAVSSDGTTNYIMTSPNGINWTTYLSNWDEYTWYNVCYSPLLNSIVAVSNTTGIQIMKTDNYINNSMISTNITAPILNLHNTVTSNYPTLGNIKNVLKNTNSYTTSLNWAWTYIICVPFRPANTYTDTIYYFGISPSGIGYSLDGITWVNGNSTTNNWNSMAWSNYLNMGVAVSSSGTNNRIITLTQNNSIASYTFANYNVNNNWTSVCWSSDLNMFVAVASSGYGNRVAISYDGLTWFTKTSPVDNNWTSICWSAELMLFVAVASSGTGNRIMTSSNGNIWTSQTSPVDNNWTSICWSAELMLFVAVASSGTGNRIMASSDGINWTSRTSPADNNWTQVIWISELYMFVACASSGTNRLMYSFDSISWNLLSTPVNNSWTSLCWNADISRLTIVSSDGTNRILKSNIFKTTYYNNILGGANLNINQETGNVSIGGTSILNPTYKLEYSDGSNQYSSSLNLINSTGNQTFSNTVDSDGSIAYTCSGSNPKLNIVNHDGNSYGLALNNILITASADNLNSINALTLGVSTALKALSVDSSKNIYGINNISTNSINISSVFSLVTPGITGYNLPAVSDSSNNIKNFNIVKVNSLSTSNKTIQTNYKHLINNPNYGSIINYTSAPLLNTYSGTLTLAWAPELNKGVSIQYSNGGNCYVSTTTDGMNWITSTNQLWLAGSFCTNAIWSPYLKACIATFYQGAGISISYNLTDWTNINNVIRNGIYYAGCWSDLINLFVIIGYNINGNSIWTSPDGLTWTGRGGPNTEIMACISVPSPIGLILTIGTDSNLYYSSNGINWTTLSISGFNRTWTSFAYSPSLQLIVAVGLSSTVATSSNGIDWTHRSAIDNSWNHVEWSEDLGIFMATSRTAPRFMISKNGINWYIKNNSIYSSADVIQPTNIVWASSLKRFIISSATTGPNNSAIMGYSNMADITSASYSITNLTNNYNLPLLNKKVKKSIGATNWCLNNWVSRSSSDDINWTSICYSSVSNTVTFVAVASSGTGNRVMTSSNGKNWSTQTSAADNNWTSVCYSPTLSLFVAVASSGTGDRVMTSSNGTSWTSQTSAVDNNWTSVCWSSELSLFVAIASSGTGDRVMTSSNGTTWTSRTSAVDNNWTSVCWSSELSLFVAVASSGTGNRVMTSSNGITWTSRTSIADNDWTSVCWSSDMRLFVAVASSGIGNRVMTSLDGISWISQYSAADYNWVCVNWIVELNCCVAISNNSSNSLQNAIMISNNCYNWKLLSYTSSTSWTSFVWSPDYAMFIAVSNTGTGNRVLNSAMVYETYKTSIIANPAYITTDNVNLRTGLGITPDYQLHLSSDSAAKPSTSTWTVSSDERLKDNIQNADLDICYNNINNLRLTKYTWKNEVYSTEQVADRSKLGWIAQEVEQILPKAVEKVNMHGYEDCRTLNTDQIIASLYGCIQKLIQKCENRQSNIDLLKSKYDEINKILDTLEIINE